MTIVKKTVAPFAGLHGVILAAMLSVGCSSGAIDPSPDSKDAGGGSGGSGPGPSGGSSSNQAGATSTIGGSAYGSGGSGQCAGLSEEDCIARYNEQGKCTPAYGYPTSQLVAGIYVGCHDGYGCTAAETCAYPPGNPAGCLKFANGCFPNDWVHSDSCASPGCPSLN
jgi:hypothetical protein